MDDGQVATVNSSHTCMNNIHCIYLKAAVVQNIDVKKS